MSAPPTLEVFVHNRVGRKGVPARRSFEQWIRAALRGRRSGRAAIVVALLDEADARALNRQFRGRDYATNVLSFPHETIDGRRTRLLGDLALCPEVIAREAREQRKPLRDHFAHLTVHGTLHLVGYDHERLRDAERMEAIERSVLADLGIPDPYA
ncbi:MAG TPA: rRNA maturation RNase YbeY [Rhodanobacteraceae bacterium]|jgi:probable rRNA maturation factor|nr:rRNA maturation RNase YbeY [Rhodanobacteraceae bacterium]